MSDWRAWASRRSGQGKQAAPVAPSAPAVASAAPGLAIPPPGFAWAHMAGQFVLVPLAQPPAPPPVQIQAPPRQPAGIVPFVQQPLTSSIPPGVGVKRTETCVLVKPGDQDTYADMLAGVPDLVPDNGGYDAMEGRPSPQTVAELQQCPEFQSIGADVPNPDAPTRSFPVGASLARGSMPLKA